MAFGRRLATSVSAAAAAVILAIFVFLLLNPSSKRETSSDPPHDLFSRYLKPSLLIAHGNSGKHLGWVRDSAADLVLRNATIYTSDASIPFAEAMAVRNGRILRVGSDASVQDLIGERTREMNLEGKVVLPGFIDSHVHLIFGGLQIGHLKLRGTKSKEDFVMKIEAAVKDKILGEWVFGGGWNNDIWGGELPAASWIDDITSDNPVCLTRMDGHMSLVNSLALKIAGITNSSLDPFGGKIYKTINGEPTGLLIDSAMKLVHAVIPEVSANDRRKALIKASNYALMKGVTTVVDMGRYFPGAPVENSWQDLSDVYKWADSSGKMLIRVCLFFPLQTWSRLSDLFKDKGRSLSQWIYIGGVKAFADGSLGSNSALFHEPYEDDPHNYGLQVSNFDWLLNATLASDKAGLQVAVHAIGDKANDMVLDLFSSVKSVNEDIDHRFRIEHAQHLVPKATSRFGAQGVIASVQPDHILDDAIFAEIKIGKNRAHRGSYLFRSLLIGGAKLAFGSDWPVADIDPLRSIKTAMTRIPPGEETAWIPNESIELDDALNAYTIGAAFGCFMEKEIGSLSAGKYADFVVLPASTWEELKTNLPSSVSATFVNGMQAYP